MTIVMAETNTRLSSFLLMIFSWLARGLLDLVTSSSGGSTPRDWAGGPSIIMLIQRICMA